MNGSSNRQKIISVRETFTKQLAEKKRAPGLLQIRNAIRSLCKWFNCNGLKCAAKFYLHFDFSSKVAKAISQDIPFLQSLILLVSLLCAGDVDKVAESLEDPRKKNLAACRPSLLSKYKAAKAIFTIEMVLMK